MIKIIGNDITQKGKKLGWIETTRIFSASGEKIGYVRGTRTYDSEGEKVSYINEGYLYMPKSGDTRISLERVSERVVGGDYPIEIRCAIFVLFNL